MIQDQQAPNGAKEEQGAKSGNQGMELRIHRPANGTATCDRYDMRFLQEPTVITSEQDLREAVQHDHVFCRFLGLGKDNEPLTAGVGYKTQDNFQSSQMLWFDVDNAGTNNPAEWADIADIKDRLKGVCFAAYTSKSHEQGKTLPDGSFESPRPKWHVAVPLRLPIQDPEKMQAMLDRLRAYVEEKRDGKKQIVTDPTCWEIARKFFGSGPNVQIIWVEDQMHFDDVDLQEIDEKVTSQVKEDSRETAGKEKKSPLQARLEEFRGKKRGSGQHMLVMQTASALRMKSALNNSECEAVIKTFALNMEGCTPQAWINDFKMKFDEGLRWVERRAAKDQDRLDEIMRKYDSLYAHVWWGHSKALIDKRATFDPENRGGAVIRAIPEVQTEEEGDLTPKKMVCYKHFDPKYRREVTVASSEFGYWLEQARKRHVEVIFDPTLPPGESPSARGYVYNLWRGFAVKPCPEGDWTRTANYILEVLARGDVELFNYYLDWVAQLLQHPETLPEVALSFYSRPQRTGKGTFFRILRGLLGTWNCVLVSNSERATAKFNGLMENKLLVLLDECVWGGDIKDRQMLKSAISETDEVIERKNLDPISMPNFKHWMIASNARHHTPVEKENRRYLCQRISAAHRHDRVYFGAIWKELKNGGYEKMMHDLLQRDISKRNWAAFPQTEETMRQMVYSFDKAEAFIFDSLKVGEPLDIGNVPFIQSSVFDQAWNSYWYKGHNETQSLRQAQELFKRIFGPFVKTHVRKTVGGLQMRGIELPASLSVYRARFAKYCGTTAKRLFGK